MKVLIYGINYSPEIVGTGKYTTELAEFLSKKDLEVRVITGNAYFPNWKTKENKYKKEIINNCLIFRSPIFVPSTPNGIKRIMHLISFLISSIPNLIQQKKWSPDVIVVIVPTLIIALNVILYKFFLGKKSLTWLHIQDLEIDAAKNLKIINLGFLFSILKKFEKFIYVSFNYISTISEDMKQKVGSLVKEKKEIFIIRNWIDKNSINSNHKITKKFKKELKINQNEITVMYSGSLNKKQDLNLLIYAVKSCPDSLRIKWLFSIEGPSKNFLIKKIGTQDNVIITSLKETKYLNSWLSVADIHLLPQKAMLSSVVMPSKLIGIMSSGKPVVASVNKMSELGKLVSKTGICTKPGNSNEFLNGIIKLAKNKSLREELGNNANLILDSIYNKEKILDEFLIKLYKLKN